MTSLMSNVPVLQRRASRQVRGRTNTNWQNLMVEVYLNPGGWTDGRTDFGIVSGDQLALCSWKEPPPGQDARLNFIDATKGDGAITPDNPIRQFLGGAGPSLKVYASYRTPHKRIKFTEQGETIIFLPDTHMHLFRDAPPDGFIRWVLVDRDTGQELPGNTKQGNSDWRRRSQVSELVQFLAYCRKFKGDQTKQLASDARKYQDANPSKNSYAKLYLEAQSIETKHRLALSHSQVWTRVRETRGVDKDPDKLLKQFRAEYGDAFTDKLQESMDESRTKAVDAALEHLAGGKALKIVQLGDLVDVWHTQLICLAAHRFLLYELGDAQEDPASPEARACWVSWYPKGDMAQIKDLSPADPNDPEPTDPKLWVIYSKKWPTEVSAADALVLFLERLRRKGRMAESSFWPEHPVPLSLRNVKVDYTRWRSIYEEIRKRYPEMNPYWGDFVAVPGNHDMFVEHPYLGFRYKYEFPPADNVFSQMTQEEKRKAADKMKTDRIRYFRKKGGERSPEKTHVYWVEHEDDSEDAGPTCGPLDGRPGLDDLEKRREHGFLTGRDNCIWFEHGHAYDPYNNRHAFFREDHAWKSTTEFGGSLLGGVRAGFVTTLIGIQDKFKGYTKDGGPAADKLKMQVANAELNRYCMQRCHDILRKSKKNKLGIRLVVLAHTHYPWLIADPRKRSTYRQRKYLWQTK